MDSTSQARNASTSGSTPVNIVHGTYPQLVVFLVLNIWPSHFGIPILLTILYLKKIQRHVTFINLCITFIIAGVSSTLLLYFGKTTGSEPHPILCLLQASLLYGYPPMTSVAAFTLVLHMFLVVRASYYGKELMERDHVIRLWMMLIGPYVAFFVGLLSTAVVGAANPKDVSRNRRFFYCSVESLALTNSITLFAAFFLFATVFMEGWLIIILYKRWRALKAKEHDVWQSFDFSMPLRVLAYGLYSTIALSLSLLSVKAPESPAPDLIIATASTCMLLIFATRREILSALIFWRAGKQHLRAQISKVEIIVTSDKEQVSYYNYNADQAEQPNPGARHGPVHGVPMAV